MKIEKIKEQLQKVSDPRRQWGNLKHKLWEMLIIALFSTMTLGLSYDEMEDFGKANEEWLREDIGLELDHGIADGDTFERVFNAIKPGELREYLNASLEITREKRGKLVNVDGKTKRGSKSKKAEALHVISAFAAENRLDKTALQLINEADMGKISKRRKMRNLALNHKLFISSILCEK
jgi:predicted Zn-dependent protease